MREIVDLLEPPMGSCGRTTDMRAYTNSLAVKEIFLCKFLNRR